MLQRKPRARYRINHISWWAQELPSDEEYAVARRSLDAVGWQVDYIITHCAPTSIALMGSRHNEADRLTDFLQEVQERAKYHYWLFGHYHDNRAIDEKHILLWEPERRKAHEHSQAHRLHHPVRRAGRRCCGAAPADGAVLRDGPGGQRQGRKRRGCRGVGIPASGLSCGRWLLSPQPAPDAGLLPDVRRHAGIAGRGNASELDTECGHHGGWIDHG